MCPFCKSNLPEGATVCGNCGAHLTTRLATVPGRNLIVLGMIWCNSVGLILLLSVLACLHAWQTPFVSRAVGTDLTICAESAPGATGRLFSAADAVRARRNLHCDAPWTDRVAAWGFRFINEAAGRLTDGRSIEQRYWPFPMKAVDYLLAVCVTLLALVLVRLAFWLWRLVFGGLSDPVWMRRS